MFLTLEILERYNACKQGKDWFAHFFPNGGELIDVINHRFIDPEILHWGFTNLTTTAGEKEAYYAKLKIDCADRETIYHCNDIINSSWITRSSHVLNSEYVFSCNDIDTCDNILSSNNVQDSHQVFNSEFVYNSQEILGSKNVNDSNNIINSDYVVRSHSVYNSANVTGSAFVTGFAFGKSRHVKNSRFVEECSNIKNCLFCRGISDAEYMLFNKSIDPEDYDVIVRQLDQLLKDWEMELVKDSVWPSQTIPLDTPVIQRNIIKQYRGLPEKFWRWVKTLPNYDSMLLYQITFQSNLITG